MAKPRQREPWEQKAEDLARSVKGLVEVHGREIDHALRQSLSEDEARARVRQLMRLVEALELELLSAGQPNRQLLGFVTQGIKIGLATIVTTATGTLTTHATTDAYHALLDSEAKADEVIECVIQQNDERGSGSLGTGMGKVVPTGGLDDAAFQPSARPRVRPDGGGAWPR